jgi:hypothetical protein
MDAQSDTGDTLEGTGLGDYSDDIAGTSRPADPAPTGQSAATVAAGARLRALEEEWTASGLGDPYSDAGGGTAGGSNFGGTGAPAVTIDDDDLDARVPAPDPDPTDEISARIATFHLTLRPDWAPRIFSRVERAALLANWRAGRAVRLALSDSPSPAALGAPDSSQDDAHLDCPAPMPRRRHWPALWPSPIPLVSRKVALVEISKVSTSLFPFACQKNVTAHIERGGLAN